MMKRFLLPLLLALVAFKAQAQLPNPALVGYWHNWNDANAPYIALDAVDNRYNVIEVAFAVPASTTDMTMTFVPDGVTQAALITKIQTMQSRGKKVLLSLGGATTSIDLTTTVNQTAFVNSLTTLLNTYGFDGLDIDIEHGNSILVTAGTITSPSNTAQLNLIAAIKQIMTNYRTTHGKKMLLTMAPETAYVQGGQSAFGSIWGGYLPIIHLLRDSLDLIQVQLYNSGTMLGLDGKIYTQGTTDFILSMTEAVIRGFNTSGGTFNGIPADKVAIGLPACTNAAGGGYMIPDSVKAAVDYLRGKGPKPGSYTLLTSGGYANLRGMMTWSINWDAVSTCGPSYDYASNYARIFTPPSGLMPTTSDPAFTIYPNPNQGAFTLNLNLNLNLNLISITNMLGQEVYRTTTTASTLAVKLDKAGVYFVRIQNATGESVQRVLVRP